MQIKMELQFALPKRYNKANTLELRQILYDEIVNYLRCNHSEDTLDAIYNESLPQEARDLAIKINAEWADAFSNVDWSYKIIEDKNE